MSRGRGLSARARAGEPRGDWLGTLSLPSPAFAVASRARAQLQLAGLSTGLSQVGDALLGVLGGFQGRE